MAFTRKQFNFMSSASMKISKKYVHFIAHRHLGDETIDEHNANLSNYYTIFYFIFRL